MNELLTSAILGTDNATAPLRDSHALLIEAGRCALMARAGKEVDRTEAVWSLQDERGLYMLFEGIGIRRIIVRYVNKRIEHGELIPITPSYARAMFQGFRIAFRNNLYYRSYAVIQGKVRVLPSRRDSQ